MAEEEPDAPEEAEPEADAEGLAAFFLCFSMRFH